MNRKVVFSLLITGLVLIVACGNSYAEESALSIDKISIGSRITAVDGDQGRYREDHFITDNYTGGLEELIMSGSVDDATLGITMHALFDYDYGLKLDLKKEDAYYLDIDTRQMRRYYDGSNEPWDPTAYYLASEKAEIPDGNFSVDRLDSSIEVGFFLNDLPNLSFGWNRWEREGEEVLLRGARARITGDTIDRKRSIPAHRSIDGISDTFFVKLEQQFAEKHNVALKQEYETYRDDQIITSPRYNNGSVEQARTFDDNPVFDESLSHLSYNSFLDEKTYVSANYLYQNLKNTTKRSSLRTNLTGSSRNHFINPEVNNRRDAHIVNFGLVLLDGIVKDLRVGANVRFEKSITKAEGQGNKENSPVRLAESEQDDSEYNESLSFSYSGIKKTNLSLTVESEQRKLRWNEKVDVNDHELVTDFTFLTVVPSGILIRDTEVRHNDFIMTLQGTHRLDRKNKVTAKYKRMNKRRKYENMEDNAAGFYPGFLGSSDQKVDQVLVRYDSSFIDDWIAGMEYAFEYNELGYAAQNGLDGSQIKRNRLVANLTGMITDKFTLNLTGMGERYDVDTPGQGGGSGKYPGGSSDFNYEAEVYLGGASGNYRLNDKTTSTLAYQHREVTGTVQNGTDEVSLSVDRDLSEDSSLETRLDWFSFRNKNEGGTENFDDYNGVAAQLIYNKDF